MKRFVARQPAAALLVGGLSCALLSGCTSDATAMTANVARDIAEQAECDELQLLEGDPNFYADSFGFHCFQGDDAIVFRYYEVAGATQQVIDDWAEGISQNNQIVYGDQWFATGPAEELASAFSSVEHKGPTEDPPPATAVTPAESNLTLCSSLTYFVASNAVRGETDEQESQYFDSYPGLDATVSRLVTQSVRDGINQYAGADPLRTDVFLTRYDDQIKEFCAQLDATSE